MVFSLKNITRLGKILYPSLTWNFPENEKVLYLTFDDGPIPEVTPWVLSLLKKYNANATFFCIGDNVEKNLNIFAQVLAEGHTTGNHTFNHLNGWKTRNSAYIQNVLLAEEAISTIRAKGKEQRKENNNTHSCPTNSNRETENQENSKVYNSHRGNGKSGASGKKLFRPPYGRITPSQIKRLKQLEYEIIMWEVVSMDFDQTLSAEHCFKIVTENAKPGSIIVFHDSLKAEKNLKILLPEVLKFYSRKGYCFKPL